MANQFTGFYKKRKLVFTELNNKLTQCVGFSIFQHHCHLLTYSPKLVPQVRVTKLRDNRIFKVFLRIKKFIKAINFNLVKHALLFNLSYYWTLFEKFQILKSR